MGGEPDADGPGKEIKLDGGHLRRRRCDLIARRGPSISPGETVRLSQILKSAGNIEGGTKSSHPVIEEARERG